MPNATNIAAWTLALGMMAMALPLAAQDVQRIAAIVNDDIVSGYDLERRIDLVIRSAGLRDMAETRRRLRSDVLRNLIDEKLQLQEARRFNISVTEADLNQAIRMIERQNNISEGGFDEFVRASGLEREAILQQVTAEIAWSRLISRRLRPTIVIGEDEIDAALSRLLENQGKPESRVSEIVLPVESPDKEQETLKVAQDLVQQIKAGASFAAVARQFSRGATAGTGGQIGWVKPGQLSDALDAVIRAMAEQTNSEPVRVAGDYYILHLHERRNLLVADPGNTKLTMKQIMLSLEGNAVASERNRQQQAANALAARLHSCDDVEAAAGRIANASAGDLGTVTVGELPAAIREAVTDLEAGQVSAPLSVPDGLMLLIVCERLEEKIEPPNRETVAGNIERRRLAMLAQRYLRDLRRTAVVELR